MKKAKRLFAGALAALLLAMSLPLSALADEAAIPAAESPGFEVSFDADDTGQDAPPAEATPVPTAEPTQEPTPTPESTETPEPTAAPTATPEATAVPTTEPTSTPQPSAALSASPTAKPTPTPSPQPIKNPVKLERDVLDNVEEESIYLFPVPDGSEITQAYSSEHKAIDIAASSGSPVYAAEDGTVSYVQIWDGSFDTTGVMSYGHMVEIKHADGNTTLYAHLSEINVQQGEKVVRGQRIGRVGSTGNSTGTHLHFEVITSEGKADPMDYVWTMPGEWQMEYTANTEAGISLTGVGDTGKSVIRYNTLLKETTTTVTGSLGYLPAKGLISNGTEYPAYCLEKEKLIWGDLEFTWSSFTVSQQTTMKAILAEGFHETNALDKTGWMVAQGSGRVGNYREEIAKWLVTQFLIWAAEKSYIVKKSDTSWTWSSQVDTDLETIANNAYNPTVVRSYYKELKEKLLKAYVIPSFASSNTTSFPTTIELKWNGSKYTATVTDTNGVIGNYTYVWGGLTFTAKDNKLTIETDRVYPEPITPTGTRTIGDDSNLAWWKNSDSSIQLVATPLGKTKVIKSYIQLRTISKYAINLTKTSADTSITDGDAGYSLAGAVYGVYNTSGTRVAGITTDANGKGGTGQVLDAGTYTVKEETAPPGYALDTTVHTVTISDPAIGTLVSNANYTLNVSDTPLIKTVTLTKTSSNTSITDGTSNYSLAGAVYDVYVANGDANHDYSKDTVVASFTTNSSGVATLSRTLKPNTRYAIKERTAPPGYVLDTTVHTFLLTYDANTMDVIDDPTTIRLTVRKKDSDTNTGVAQGNASLAGAQYKITYVNGTNTVETTVTTNSAGTATLRGLPIGVTVKVQETVAPVGYKLDSRIHTYVTTTETEKIEYELEPEDFTEDVFKGKIQIMKSSEMAFDEKQIEAGAEFEVYLKSAGSYADAAETERDYLVTGADGKATTKDLPYGTYTIHQVKGVAGREFVDKDVDVFEDGKTYEVDLLNEFKTSKIRIIKTSEDGIVEGMRFKVTRLQDDVSQYYTTDANGEILTDELPVYIDPDGTQVYRYRIQEVDVPSRYSAPAYQNVELTYGETAEVHFENKLANGTLILTKVDQDGTTPLEGAKFEITDADGNVVATETTDKDGKITVTALPAGTFQYKEIEAPEGYDLDPEAHEFTLAGGETLEITQENTPSVGSITVKKVDTGGNPMKGVQFALEYSADNGATWEPVEARAEDSKPSVGGCTSAVVDGRLVTDENGIATFNGLQINNSQTTIIYRLTETETLSGNTLLAAPLFEGSLPQVLDGGAETVNVSITAVNGRSFELPGSGSTGMMSVPIGIALILISASCAIFLARKKRF